MKKLLCLFLAMMVLMSCTALETSQKEKVKVTMKEVEALFETTPVDVDDDAADDPAIWVHPLDPDKSLVLGTNKKKGLEVYDLSGKRLQVLPTGRLNNVDIRQNVLLGKERVDLAVATNRTTRSLDIFRIDRKDGEVTLMQELAVALTLDEPYGICLYQPSGLIELHAFVNDKDGRYQQWRINEVSILLGEFKLDSQPEGCVADDDNKVLYAGEENKGVWRVELDEPGVFERALMDKVGSGRLTADVEGMTLYRSSAKTGYLLVSSQGSNSYAVYERHGSNRYIDSFRIIDNRSKPIDGSSETDGISVSSVLSTSVFPEGLLVVQDGKNTRPEQNQNFKYISWKDIRQALGLGG